MKSIFTLSLVALMVVGAPAVKLGGCGPSDGMMLQYLSYMPPSFSPVQSNCQTCLVYYGREYSVSAIGSSLAGKRILPSLADEKSSKVSKTWFEFRTDVPVTVYLVAATESINVFEAQGCGAWLTPGGWSRVSNGGNDDWSVTYVGDHSGTPINNKYDCVWKKTGSYFALNGQGNGYNQATGAGGMPTYLVLIDTGTDTLELDTGGAVCKDAGVKPAGGVVSSTPIAFYPNPFSGQVNISFAANMSGNVLAQVFDLEGRVVRRLSVIGNSAVWDGRDNRGFAVNAGVYLVRMSSGDKVYSDKVVINR